MDKIKFWFIKHRFEINWFLIGFLTCSGFDNIGNGELLEATFDFGIAYINYLLNRR